jgi:hypothetical protein
MQPTVADAQQKTLNIPFPRMQPLAITKPFPEATTSKKNSV